ncbi:hypothetical protein FRC01_003761, partial [Tulasnella sp. 417]
LNVLVFSEIECRAVITDFGSARRLTQHDPNGHSEQVKSSSQEQQLNATFCDSTNTITLTRNNYTLRWAAPELLNEDRVSLWSDIWALGWIAYEVMTSSLPFQDVLSDILVVHHVLQGDLPSLANDGNFSLIHELCSLMNMCWRNNPTERPTAEVCKHSIQQMPMFAPENDDLGAPLAERILNIDQLIELGALYESRGEYRKAFHFFVRALDDSRDYGEPDQRVSSLRAVARLYGLRNNHRQATTLYPEIRELDAESKKEGVEDAVDDLSDPSKPRLPGDEHAKATELHREGREILEEEYRTKALCGQAQVNQPQPQYQEAISLEDNPALDVLTGNGNQQGGADDFMSLTDEGLLNKGLLNEALAKYSEALQRCIERGDKEGNVDALFGLARVHRLQNRYNEAITVSSEALRISTEIHDTEYGAGAQSDWPDSNSSWAFMVCCLAAGIWKSHDVGEPEVWWQEGRVYPLQSQCDKAIALHLKALEIRTSLGDRGGRADTLFGLAQAHRFQDRYKQALPLYSEALATRTNIGDRKGRAQALCGLADVIRLLERYDIATALYSHALQIYTDLENRKGRGAALWGLAEVQRLRSDYNEAISLYTEALEMYTALLDEEGRADALWGLAQVRRLQNQYNEAIPLYCEALQLYNERDDKQDRVAALLGLTGAALESAGEASS